MKLTIIIDDNAVYKDKASFAPVDLSCIPSNVHALQFDNVTNIGHIEFKDSPNEEITELPDWAVIASSNYDTAVTAYQADQAEKLAIYIASKNQNGS
jgi:hypothetical protein